MKRLRAQMGHNKAGANRKARLKRRRKQEQRIAPRVEQQRITQYIGKLRGEEWASNNLIARIRLGPWIPGSDGTTTTRSRIRDVQIEWVDEKHPRWQEFEEEPINALKKAGQRHYLFRRDARKIEVLEEHLHAAQERLVLRQPRCAYLERYPIYELHVKDFMIRHRRLLGINRHDTRILQLMMLVQMLSSIDENREPLELPASARWRIRR